METIEWLKKERVKKLTLWTILSFILFIVNVLAGTSPGNTTSGVHEALAINFFIISLFCISLLLAKDITRSTEQKETGS